MTTADLYGGHSVPLRALEIAQVGGHSIALWGPVGAGKHTLASCFPIPVQIVKSCHCGHLGSMTRECYCPDRLKRHSRWIFECVSRSVDMLVEVAPLPVRDALGPKRGEREHTMMLARIDAAKNRLSSTGNLNMDDSGNRILEMAARRLALTVGQLEAIRRVSRTIAVMAGDTAILGRAVAEATQYLALQWPGSI